ncbi:hypothetical protein EV642_1597, partial [Kribbella sp. VKM Ac-2500]
MLAVGRVGARRLVRRGVVFGCAVRHEVCCGVGPSVRSGAWRSWPWLCGPHDGRAPVSIPVIGGG